MAPEYPFVSIIIPTYNAERTIAMCLEACLAQDYPKERYEVILVDNASTDGTAKIAKSTQGVKYLYEGKQGPAAARNAGARAAQGEIIVFTDADCKPQGDWLEQLMEGYRQGNVACAGEIVPLDLDHIIERFTWERGILVQSRMVQGQGEFPFPISANFSMRKEIFEDLGGFDEDYMLPGGEDLDIGWKMAREGIAITYLPEAIVLHKHRTTYKGLTRQFFRYRVGICQFYKKHLNEFGAEKLKGAQKIGRGELRLLARMLVWGLRRLRKSKVDAGTQYWRCDFSIGMGHLLGKLAWRWKYAKLCPTDPPRARRALVLQSACCWRVHNDPFIKLGAALNKQGIKTTHWIGGGLTCSIFGTLRDWEMQHCIGKQRQNEAWLKEAKCEYHYLDELIGDEVRAKAEAYWESLDKSAEGLLRAEYAGISLWRAAFGAVCRRLKRHVHTDEITSPEVLEIVEDYYKAGVAAVEIAEQLFRRARPDVILLYNGYFLLERIIGEMARRRGLRVVAHENSSMKDLKLFCATGTVGNRHEMSSLATLNVIEGNVLSAEQRGKVQARVEAICSGAVNTIRQREASGDDIRRQLGIAEGRRLALLIGQVPFDTVMLYDAPMFASMYEFLKEVMRIFAEMSDWQLVVRLHPFEEEVGQDSTYKALSQERLPENVTLIHGREINTYDLMRVCNMGIVSTSQAGLEMAALGKPVVVVGQAFYRGKGFTWDVDRREYLPMVIKDIAQRRGLTPEQTARLENFLYHYFFEYLVPFDAEHDDFSPAAVYRIRKILFPT